MGAYRHGVAFLSAQVTQLVAAIDTLLRPQAAAGAPKLNGAGGPILHRPDPVQDEFKGQANASWNAAHQSVANAQAALSAGDEAAAAILAALHERAAQVRQRLNQIRTELLELTQDTDQDEQTRAGKTELVDIASAKAQELRRIAKEAQQFSEQQAQKLHEALALYRATQP
ncbi:Uncharacterised protein [Mycobacteroides abscessus subsp. bolletii]|nr:Uncharacterised protein [Mycobacteroides abscessus subsp. bolletii]SKS83780.1 Uncharacterised protein [Mycobacteroides abscessus subsp. bolletii]